MLSSPPWPGSWVYNTRQRSHPTCRCKMVRLLGGPWVDTREYRCQRCITIFRFLVLLDRPWYLE